MVFLFNYKFRTVCFFGNFHDCSDLFTMSSLNICLLLTIRVIEIIVNVFVWWSRDACLFDDGFFAIPNAMAYEGLASMWAG